MDAERASERSLLSLVLFSSLASLSFELALMRFFSVSLWHHFAFMVISIAMLGIAAAGTALSVLPRMKDARRIPLYSLLLAACIPASCLLANAIPFDPARLSWDRTQLLLVGLYYLFLSIPFFFFGLVVSTAYVAGPSGANAVYAADLAGAGLGALAAAWLLSLGGPELGVFIASSLLATGILSSAGRRMRIAASLLLVLNMAVLTIQPGFIRPRISPYRPLALALQFPGARHIGVAYGPSGRVDLFSGPAARYAPGLSFRYLDPLPEQTGLAIDAAELHAITSERDAEALRFLRFLPSGLAYRLGGNNDVLVIDPRGGLAVLMARGFGAGAVTSVESNPLVRDVVRAYGKAGSSSVFAEHSFTGLGRSWLATAGRTFDVIDIPILGAMPSAAFGFSEDYRFTVEAFREYLSRLKPGGFLSLNLYIIPPPRTELRLLATIVQAAEGLGIRNMPERIAAIRSWDTLTIIVKNGELVGEDIARIKIFCRELRFDLVYYPGIKREESNVNIRMRGNEYFDAFQKLMDPAARERFIRDYLFDIRPATDERPFFHYYLKLKNLRETYRVMGEKWQYFFEEGYLLPLLLLQAAVVSAALVLLPLVKRPGTVSRRVAENAEENRTSKSVSRKDAKHAKGEKGSTVMALAHFALLGLGFLFIEVALIQKMVLVLEHPAYAASTVIAATLISSGIGSMLSRRFEPLRSPRTLLVLAGTVALLSLAIPAFSAMMVQFPLGVRIVFVTLLIMPAGILMGIPFPLGMSALGRSAPDLIPWAWAVNGCFSVLSPILAIMLALVAGFNVVLFAGAGMYLLAYGVMRIKWKGRHTREGGYPEKVEILDSRLRE